jgi:hypothetical protein
LESWVPGTGRVIEIIPVCNKKTNLEVEGLVKPICQFLPCQADFGFCLTGRVLKGGFQNYLSVGGQFLIERDL